MLLPWIFGLAILGAGIGLNDHRILVLVVSGFGAGREFRTVDEETVIDAQASWFFGGRLTGLTALLQVYNLTDEAFRTYANDDTRQIIDYQRYGRTYLAGLSYSW